MFTKKETAMQLFDEQPKTECRITHDGVPLRGDILRYPSGQLGIQFYAAESIPEKDIFAGSPWDRPTLNIPEWPIRPDQVWMRTYDEHEGFLEAMVVAGVLRITTPNRATPSGEVLCDLLLPAPRVEKNGRAGLLEG
jgi:hypothetical protein